MHAHGYFFYFCSATEKEDGEGQTFATGVRDHIDRTMPQTLLKICKDILKYEYMVGQSIIVWTCTSDFRLSMTAVPKEPRITRIRGSLRRV